MTNDSVSQELLDVPLALTKEKETLLITLYAKAGESRLPDSQLQDRFAAEAVSRIDYDFAKLKMRRGRLESGLWSRHTDFSCGSVRKRGLVRCGLPGSRRGMKMVQRHHSVRATGATLAWSIEDPREIEAQVPKLKYIAERVPYDTAQISRMSWLARATIKLFLAIPPLRKMARIFRYRF